MSRNIDFSKLPNSEEPIPVIPQNNLLHPKPPIVTAFNKKTVTFICLILGAVVFFTILAVLQPPRRSDTLDTAGNKLKTEKVGSNNILPDEMINVPSSYSGQDLTSKSDIPIPVLPSEDQYVPPTNVTSNNQLSPEEQTKIEARKSHIRFISLDQQSQNQTKQVSNSNGSNSIPNNYTPVGMPNLVQDQNGQDEKQAFLYSNSTTTFYTNAMGLRPPLSKFEVKAGSVIPVTLITGINSDLPGYITAQVRENIYDTASGRFLLIPQGTKIIGVYDSKIAYAQNRLLVAWSRLILPNGKSLALEGMTGADTGGYAGLKDKVNNHFDKIIVGGLLTSLMGAGSKMLSSGDQTANQTYEQLAASGAASSLAEAGIKVFEKNLNIQPTIEIRPGIKFNIFVDRDLILESYQKK